MGCLLTGSENSANGQHSAFRVNIAVWYCNRRNQNVIENATITIGVKESVCYRPSVL